MWFDSNEITDLENAIVALMKCVMACRYAENDMRVKERIKIEVDSWENDEVYSRFLEKV